MDQKIRVVLAEDHHVVRAAFAALLAREPDIDVIGEVSNTANLVETVTALAPQVLILDAHMPGGRVVTAARALRALGPAPRILVLSAYERSEYVVGLLRAGAAGYVLKHDPSEMLVTAVRAVAAGEEWLSPRVAEILLRSLRSGSERPTDTLTDRELEVLSLMARGYKNVEIAVALVITVQTVKNHVRRIFRKLGVDNRVGAVLYAINLGLDEPVLDPGQLLP